MVKAAEDRLRWDGAKTLNRAMQWGVLVQGSMGSRLIIIMGVSKKDRKRRLGHIEFPVTPAVCHRGA
jgi:hypothetical protein